LLSLSVKDFTKSQNLEMFSLGNDSQHLAGYNFLDANNNTLEESGLD